MKSLKINPKIAAFGLGLTGFAMTVGFQNCSPSQFTQNPASAV